MTATDQTPKRRSSKKSWKKPFLEMLAQSMNVMLSCKAAAVTRAVAYAERKRSKVFAQQWHEATSKALELLEATAWKRATTGTMEPIWRNDENGKPVKVDQVARCSDTLLIFLLKANRPEKYRETIRQELSGPGGEAIPVRQEPAEISKEEVDELLRVHFRERIGVSLGGNGSNGGNGHGRIEGQG